MYSSRSAGSTPYEYGHSDAYPLEAVFKAASAATDLGADPFDRVLEALADEDSAVRYWAAVGFLARGERAVRPHAAALRGALEDESPHVRVVAAEALGRYGSDADLASNLASGDSAGGRY